MNKNEIMSLVDLAIEYLDSFQPPSPELANNLRHSILSRYLIESELVNVPSADSFADKILKGDEYVLKAMNRKLGKNDPESIIINYLAKEDEAIAMSNIIQKLKTMSHTIEFDGHSSAITFSVKTNIAEEGYVEYEIYYPAAYLKLNPPRHGEHTHKSVSYFIPHDNPLACKLDAETLRQLDGYSATIYYKYAEGIGFQTFIPDLSKLSDKAPPVTLTPTDISANLNYKIEQIGIPKHDVKAVVDFLTPKIIKHFQDKPVDDYSWLSLYHSTVGGPVERSSQNSLLSASNKRLSIGSVDSYQAAILQKQLLEKIL